ncbi:MAG TPA: sigma-70 family RNA polymerase sigma factor, partial [Blastocatellia bacterium]|nr:sigma-70 family RNA polymerase sigma factor [Blastocatellia bacterium]
MSKSELPPASPDVTQLLQDWRKGDEAARNELMGAVYEELRRQAGRYLRRERSDHTLQPTALVHEAYIQLIDQSRVNWESRAHFFGAAARLMRRILVDHARAHQAEKRGSGEEAIALDEALGVPDNKDVNLLALNDALDELTRLDARQSQVVELRYFGGLSIEETAAVLDISPATVKREWSMAKVWLHHQIRK